MDIRPYTSADREGCLAIFDSNLEAPFIAPEHREAYAGFLDRGLGQYFVMEHEGRLVGCGGHDATAGVMIANLHWAMIARGMQRQGLGRYLLLYNVKAIARVPGVKFLVSVNPPTTAPFFEKYGFRAERQMDNGLVAMRMKLEVCP